MRKLVRFLFAALLMVTGAAMAADYKQEVMAGGDCLSIRGQGPIDIRFYGPGYLFSHFIYNLRIELTMHAGLVIENDYDLRAVRFVRGSRCDLQSKDCVASLRYTTMMLEQAMDNPSGPLKPSQIAALSCAIHILQKN